MFFYRALPRFKELENTKQRERGRSLFGEYTPILVE